MENQTENNKDLKSIIISKTKENQKKIYIFFVIIISITFILAFLNHKNEKQNVLISEKYISAGLNLTANNKKKALKVYEEIIYSKNEFYAMLSLNNILENQLVDDKNKIIKYFENVEDLNLTKDQKDLIIFKKALFLIKNTENEEGKKLLSLLAENESKLKKIANEILDNQD